MGRRRTFGFGFLLATAMLLASVPAHAGLGTTASGGVRDSARTPNSVQWQVGPASPFGGARFDGEYVASQRRVYFLGFRTFGDATDGSIWYFDLPSQSYVDTGVDMPIPISNYGVAALTDANGRGLYTFGGRTAVPEITQAVQVYYPATGQTRIVNSDPWPGHTPSGCVSTPAMGVVVVANRAVVMGGMTFSTYPGCVDDQSAETWIFNPMAAPGTRWTRGPDLNVARGYITPAVVGDKVYAIGGDRNELGTLMPLKAVEAWTFPSGIWSNAPADLPQPCDESQAFSFSTGPLGPGIVVAGCGQWPNALPDTLAYDAVGNTWSLAGSLGETRRNHAGALVSTAGQPRMLILGGYNETTQFADPTTTSELGRGAALVDDGVAWRSAPGTTGGLVPTS